VACDDTVLQGCEAMMVATTRQIRRYARLWVYLARRSIMTQLTYRGDFVLGLAPITVLSAISTVMIFGLLADIMNTWFLNAGLLKWYMGTPEAKAKYG